ncbi:Uncharacterised protein [Vibrio cholerae]|nr:Uncharacterised protein [Vibrio cholerae]
MQLLLCFVACLFRHLRLFDFLFQRFKFVRRVIHLA